MKVVFYQKSSTHMAHSEKIRLWRITTDLKTFERFIDDNIIFKIRDLKFSQFRKGLKGKSIERKDVLENFYLPNKDLLGLLNSYKVENAARLDMTVRVIVAILALIAALLGLFGKIAENSAKSFVDQSKNDRLETDIEQYQKPNI
jgi:hypothetical protein